MLMRRNEKRKRFCVQCIRRCCGALAPYVAHFEPLACVCRWPNGACAFEGALRFISIFLCLRFSNCTAARARLRYKQTNRAQRPTEGEEQHARCGLCNLSLQMQQFGVSRRGAFALSTLSLLPSPSECSSFLALSSIWTSFAYLSRTSSHWAPKRDEERGGRGK